MSGEQVDCPTFSVIIPTLNRRESLGRCLRGLREQAPIQGGFDVIVVDDGSPEETRQAIREHGADLDLTFEQQPTQGPGAARNLGVGAARGRYLAFIDDDCVPEPDWLVQLAAVLHAEPEALIGGTVKNRFVDNPFSQATQLILDLVFEDQWRTGDDMAFLPTVNMAVSRAEFLSRGGFDDTIPARTAEDKELCVRWCRHGRGLLCQRWMSRRARRRRRLAVAPLVFPFYKLGTWISRLCAIPKSMKRLRNPLPPLGPFIDAARAGEWEHVERRRAAEGS